MTGECEQCEVVMINGVRCHETGCPLAWRDYTITCNGCGLEFKPQSRLEAEHQRYCDVDCQP